jgi:hypothetical protein
MACTKKGGGLFGMPEKKRGPAKASTEGARIPQSVASLPRAMLWGVEAIDSSHDGARYIEYLSRNVSEEKKQMIQENQRRAIDRGFRGVTPCEIPLYVQHSDGKYRLLYRIQEEEDASNAVAPAFVLQSHEEPELEGWCTGYPFQFDVYYWEGVVNGC